MNVVKFEAVEDNILTIREVQVILDSDVAELYGVDDLTPLIEPVLA